jgi:ABC-type uncharacterized transport system permease subunit
MVSLLVIGNWLLPLLYLALLIDYGATFFLRTRAHERDPWLPGVVGLHALLLVVRAIHLGHPPLVSSLEILSAVALAMAAVYAVIEFSVHDRRSGIFVLSLAFLFQYSSSILLAGTVTAPAAEAPESSWARLHLIPALVAYTALAFAAVYGILYLTARRNLRLHRFGVFFDRLPPLDLLARMTWLALVTGFIFMTLTIATGPLMAETGDSGTHSTMITAKVLSKIITGGVAWTIFAVAILGRWLGKWSPARTSGVAVVGCVVVMALLIISALLS